MATRRRATTQANENEQAKCETCDGTGIIATTPNREGDANEDFCTICNGTGYAKETNNDANDNGDEHATNEGNEQESEHDNANEGTDGSEESPRTPFGGTLEDDYENGNNPKINALRLAVVSAAMAVSEQHKSGRNFPRVFLDNLVRACDKYRTETKPRREHTEIHTTDGHL